MKAGNLESWMVQRARRWKEVSALQAQVEKGGHADIDAVLDAGHSYREVGHDLALLQKRMPGSRVTQQLQRMYSQLHRSLHRKPSAGLAGFGRMIRDDIPRVVRELRAYIFWVTILFAGSTIAGWLMVSAFPELASLFASPEMIEGVREGRVWVENLTSVFPPSLLSWQILFNNIIVALTACCLGILFGLGTVYIIVLNGLMLGGLFAFTAQHGLAGKLFEFVIAHGIVELSAICIAGAVGISIGEALVRPQGVSRRVAFERASKRGMQVMVLIVVFLFGAGFIEGYVSTDAAISLGQRAFVGCAYMALFLAAMIRIRSGKADSPRQI